jgi:phosphoribosylpyrophosphate synthetase
LRNVVREPMRTCRTCTAPVDGYQLCWRCRDHQRVCGLADLVAPLAYALDGTESAALLRNYKNHPLRSERERCGSIVGEVLRLGRSLHERCVGTVVGQPVSTRLVIPSLTSRIGIHPMVSIAESLGSIGDVVLRPAFDARCDRVVDEEKFVVDGAVTGRHVLVLDDVWTTGSNAQSATLTLRRAGAAAVSVMVIARWLSPRHPLSANFIRERLREDYNPLVCPVTGHRCP